MDSKDKSNARMNNKFNRFKPYNKKKNLHNDTDANSSGGNNTKFDRFKADQGSTIEKEDNNKQLKRFQSPFAPAISRILARRYILTRDGNKYLEIGMRIEKRSDCYVEIALGEVSRKEIIMNRDDWRKFIQYKSDNEIQQHFHAFEKKCEGQIVPLLINSTLKIVFDVYKDNTLLYLIGKNSCLVMAESTYLRLVDLNTCIETTFSDLESIKDDIRQILSNFDSVVKRFQDLEPHQLNYNECDIITAELIVYFSESNNCLK